MSDFADIRRKLGDMGGPHEFFGGDPHKTYRRLAQQFHPDVAGEAGAEVMGRINLLWEQAKRQIAEGTYGQDNPSASPLIVTSKKRTYTNVVPLVAGDVSRLYTCEWDGGTARGVLKVVVDQRDADLLANEATTLNRLRKTTPEGDHPYYPEVLDSFAFSVPGKPRRRANVLNLLEGYYSLEEVKAEYPGGVDLRDAAWIARRILYTLGSAHEAGVLHGAVLPSHVMIHPAKHGVVLVGWGSSVPINEAIRVRSRSYKDWYPDEVPNKMAATQATDVAMFARTYSWLIPQTTEAAPFHTFTRGCRLPQQKMRPCDCFALLGELDELLARLWGKRKFHQFSMTSPSRA